jgi:hypothetical protein
MPMNWERKDEEGQRAAPPHRWARLLLGFVAVALLTMAAIGSSNLRAWAAQTAQAAAQVQPAKSEPEAAPGPEEVPAQAAQPRATTPNAGQSAAGAPQSGGSQAAADCASLLKLATDLKAEVDKTTKEELSVSVVRKADEIEQLARKVRKK